MKTPTTTPSLRRTAFTLIELLVVIAVIAILASLIFPITAGIKKKRLIAVAQTELSQIETAIESYKSSRGYYPPDNPDNPLINQLYFELLGASNNGTYYVTKDGGQIGNTVAALNAVYGPKVSGLVNVSKNGNADDVAASKSFLTQLKPGQTAALPAGPKVLTCSILWDKPPGPVPGDSTGINPWRYVSSTPTNLTTYDLWVDILVGGKTNRISNWSTVPQIVAY